jgi:hypothetical protein
MELEAETINLNFIVDKIFYLLFRFRFSNLVQSETGSADQGGVVAKGFDGTEVS